MKNATIRLNKMTRLKRRKKAPKWLRAKHKNAAPIKRYLLSDKPLNYDEYLAGPYWQKLRKEVLSVRSACEDCGTDRRLNLHHRYYYKDGKSVLYRERQHTDIFEVLCYFCHMQRHNACSPAVLEAQPSTKASTPGS